MMKHSDIKRLLRQSEGQFLERKSRYEIQKGKRRLRKAREVAKDVAETLCAFGNADGGTLLLGINDDGSLSGMDYPDDKIRVIRDAPKNLIRPFLKPEIQEVSYTGKRLLIFTVKWLPEVYQLTDGRYLLRIGDANMPFPAEQIEMLKKGKRKALFESHFEPTASLNDIDTELISESGLRIGLPEKPEDLLYRFRLLDYEDGRPKLKLAALLLFGKDPLRWHPRCGIDFIKYEGIERKVGRELNIIKRARIELPLTRLIDEAYKTISPHIKERQYRHDLFFVEQFEYPSFAWQEAIVNAIAHRDYNVQGLSIEVWMFDDRIEVRSPGLPPEPVTIERILRRERIHASRNPLIVRVLTELGHMRETGEGIPRMFEEMEKNGLYPPDFQIVANSVFSLTLKNQPMYSLDDMEWLKHFSSLHLNPNQRRMLIFGKAHSDSFTSRDYQKVCDLGIYEAGKEIKDMVRLGIIKLNKRGGRIYTLQSKEKWGTVEEPIEFIPLKQIIHKKGFLKNSDIQKALGVSRFKATKLAKRLVEIGLLRKEGKGKGSRYLAIKG
ncbi:MAG: putative DNA binding domain-containing protein [Deltaproteobacteria bacterium]|nr:putative DNA binding domain-containing protein [Deltaproteobacteria bacterium]